MGKTNSTLAHSMEMGEEFMDDVQENAVSNQVPPQKNKEK